MTVESNLLQAAGLTQEDLKRLSEAPITAELYEELARKWTFAALLGANEHLASLNVEHCWKKAEELRQKPLQNPNP